MTRTQVVAMTACLCTAASLTLRPAVAPGSSGRSARYVFCGLARTVNGFDLVDAHDIACGRALALIGRIEQGRRGIWNCSRAMHAVFELRCQAVSREVRVLERAPVRVTRAGATVRLRNWSFHLAGNRLLAREGRLGWVSLGPAPWCVPFAGPREVLLALRLRPLTPSGGCFRTR